MARIFVIPAEGRHIPSPGHNHQALPPEGAWVDASTYWTKRLNAGDVSDDTEAKAKEEAAAEAKAAKASKAVAPPSSPSTTPPKTEV